MDALGKAAVLRAEVERASGHYYGSDTQTGIDNQTRRFLIERVRPYLQGPHVLDLGYIDGVWTDELVSCGFKVDVVEGATRHVEAARLRYAGEARVRVYEALFQEYRPDRRYQTVIAGDMIRYIPEPVPLLRGIGHWLDEGGRLIATVPNSRSLHRRVGALMGMEPTPTAANSRDVEVGNLRQFDRYEFRDLLRQAGYRVEIVQGCFLKPLSSRQMQGWEEPLLRAFLEMGDELQDYCWFLYAVCTLP